MSLAWAGAAWLVAGPARAVAVLVVATPCPLILAAPVALVSGLSVAARRGVVVKGGGVLERLAQCTTLLLDKTGTLTSGRPQVAAIIPAAGHEPAEILRLAASLDQVSVHVLAGAVVEAAAARGGRAGVAATRGGSARAGRPGDRGCAPGRRRPGGLGRRDRPAGMGENRAPPGTARRRAHRLRRHRRGAGRGPDLERSAPARCRPDDPALRDGGISRIRHGHRRPGRRGSRHRRGDRRGRGARRAYPGRQAGRGPGGTRPGTGHHGRGRDQRRSRAGPGRRRGRHGCPGVKRLLRSRRRGAHRGPP